VSLDHATAPAVARLRQARGRKDATVRWLYLLTPIVLVAFAVPALLADPGAGRTGRHLVASVALGAFVVGVLGRNATAAHPFRAAHFGFVTALLAGAVALMWVQPDGPGAEGVLLGVLCVARLLPVKAAIALLLGGFVALALIVLIVDHNYGHVVVLVVLGALYGLLFLAHRLSEANKQAEQLLAQLARGRTAEARAAGLAERQRLAREMHDVLAHSLTGLVLQLEGTRMLATEDSHDPRLLQAINRAYDLGRTGLNEARRAIGTLRDDELPGPERLESLAAQFEQDRDIPCRLIVSGAAYELGSEASLAVYRVAQEALTNIAKHARPERVEVHLAYESSRTRLTVEDFTTSNGDRPYSEGGEVADGAGYGLTGMRERAELLGGRLTTEATDSGFRVALDVPV
jgi:signal transduction histidine kinase